ncbi:pyrimidine-nucleoside phosphorylase [Virgibacillus sp. 179-BFC.A HS]|uniref:Pyrimidine-nucleoside phosphorylase n=1 Tax=Tigheibacillus jepli TaxID=3035914 RepID=A0ABU5CHG0_9BACI|nr:pyrimidine-nucleoside phosphorylase [Virgibacillus sp. 179-BFC.A HS]MDY0405650.1 pyrimidine-nucleoside phosphorylase [Virgibacillus sp. 179-BFC.A HS]
MRITDIIEKKRDGNELTKDEIDFFVDGYTKGEIPDYQISALLMAIYFQDMTAKERALLTSAMVESGDQIDLSAIEGIKVDKHSTGGVGDTTTLILGPLVSSLGVPVAKMSGRGLGHTGGTLDKLESVPGFHIELSNDEFINLVNNNKLAVIGQSGNLTPADKKMYSLRDVTGTVNSIALIASSIMSKKIASGADAIVLDVKTGAGAFMKKLHDAEELAHAMVSIGNHVGRKTMAVISDMSQPLGYAIGNALEVKEAIKTLQGNGPKDLTELCLTLGSRMVVLAKQAETIEEAREKLTQNLANGQAFAQFKKFLASQGGDGSVADNTDLLPRSKWQIDLPAKKSGYVSEIIADRIGKAAMLLGAGRATKDSEIDLAVGIMLQKKVGDQVKQDEPLLTLHTNTQDVESVKELLYSSIAISEQPVKAPTLIYGTIED